MNDTTETNLEEYSRFLDGAGKHFTYEALSVYRNFSDTLSKKEARFFEQHLSKCVDCTARLQEITEIEGEIESPVNTNIIKFSPVMFRFAAAALLIVAVGAALWFNRSGEPRPDPQQPSNQPEEIVAETTIDPERFVTNQILENFVERTVRSGETAAFTNLRNGDTLSSPFRFQWSGQGKDFTVTIVDNMNVEAWKMTTKEKTISAETTLPAGLYYVKLSEGNELVCVGKFVVLR